jgi:hypothetical protein
MNAVRCEVTWCAWYDAGFCRNRIPSLNEFGQCNHLVLGQNTMRGSARVKVDEEYKAPHPLGGEI